VHDKQVRRRRAVLGVLVGASLILLTAYFGESPNSPLHSIQRGIVEVFSPVQEGASKVLSPVRDVANWFSSTFRAKSQVDRLNKRVHELEAQVAQLQQYELEYNQVSKEVGLDARIGASSYAPVAANVYERSPSLWYSQLLVDKGSADGVHSGDPVISQNGLVGKVLYAYSTVSVVQLITDHSMSVTAEVQDSPGDTGELVPAVGNPNQLELTYLPSHAQISQGQLIVTAGFKDGTLDSLYPAGIPIGTVTNASQAELLCCQQIQVAPLVDLNHITSVQILTHPQGSTLSASLNGTSKTAQVGGP
jgi:rod shape-determining protein MreC